MDKVRCADCGFLALVDHSRQLVEADAESRSTGNAPDVPFGTETSGPGWIRSYPNYKIACSVMAFDLSREADSFGGDAAGPTAVLAVLGLDRACPKWTPWHPGHSPKEHRRMVFEKEVREATAQQAELMREFQRKQKEDDRRYNEEQKKKDRLWGIIIAIGGIIIGAILKAR